MRIRYKLQIVERLLWVEFGLSVDSSLPEYLCRRQVAFTSEAAALLLQRTGMDEEGAIEFFEYNIQGAKFRHLCPVFLRAC
jgi:hypothetical protein